MKFIHSDFELKVTLQNQNDTIGEDYKKSVEFIFCEEKNFIKELKKVGGNVNRNKQETYVGEKANEVFFIDGYSQYEKSNIFYDYNNIIFEINNNYTIQLIDENIEGSSFLEDITETHSKINKYRLGYTRQNNNSNEVFGFWGFVKFRIYKDTKSYIFAPFFKTKNLKEDEDVKDMVETLKRELLSSLLNYRSISNFGYKIKKHRNKNQQLWEFINIFNEIYYDLEKSVMDICKTPKYINTSSYEYKKYNSGKIHIDSRLIKYALQKGYIANRKLNILGKTVPQRLMKGEYNNIPNKIFIDLLQSITQKLDTFLKVGKTSRLQEDQLQKIRNKKNILAGKRISFIRKYDINVVKLGNYSLDFQYLDSKYKKFVMNYHKLFFLLDLLQGEILIENTSLDQIYEYWTLIEIRDMFYDGLQGKEKKDIFTLKKVKDNLIFQVGDIPLLIHGKNSKCKIIYKFQKNISSIGNYSGEKRINDIRIISSQCKPDIFVEIYDKVEQKSKYVIFDAKYSTTEYGDIYKKRLENLYKYKSGIIKCENLQWDHDIKDWTGNIIPIIDYVLAIYPGVSHQKLAKLYKKSITDVGFGGLVLRKGETQDVRDFIETLLS